MPQVFRLAYRTKTLTDTTVVDLLKAAANPKIISFAGGVPSSLTFPIGKLKQAATAVFTKYGNACLQYQPTQGIPNFLETLADCLSQKWKIKIKPENIIITSGSQQAIDLLGKSFLNPKDLVIVERPGYFVALQAFSAYEPKFAEINFKNNQLDLKRLKTLIQKKPKIVYLNPNFQNPTGQTLILKQKQTLAKLSRQFPQTLFVEDTAYTDLYFNNPTPDLITFSSNIVHLGTFSKILAPGLRLGYIVGPKKLIYNLTLIKQSMDLHTNSLSQLLVNELLKDKKWLKKHLQKTRQFYFCQAQSMEQLLKKYLKQVASWNLPTGGLFFWLKTNINTKKLYRQAFKQNVAFVPGHVFFAKKPQYHYLRLSFATVDKKTMEEGIKRLAKLLC